MSFGLKVTGDLAKQIEQFKDVAQAEFETAVKLTAMEVLGDAVKSIQRGSKTGKIYKRGKDGYHQASAPGEAPASDTGRLAGDSYPLNALKVGEVEAIIKGLNATVGTHLTYGRYLEYGTTRMAERPWLRPAIDYNRPVFIGLLTKAITKAAK